MSEPTDVPANAVCAYTNLEDAAPNERYFSKINCRVCGVTHRKKVSAAQTPFPNISNVKEF